VILLVVSASLLSAQPTSSSEDALLDALVWGAYETIDPSAYSDEMTTEIADYVRRVRQNCPKISFQASGEVTMIRTGQLRYACRLAAMSADREAQQLAVTYTVGLQPCREWEGHHDCPEHEAQFADEYHSLHLNGPFRAYLPLLAAHRWLCAAEAYDRESRPTQAYLSRRWYEQRLGTALRSESRLVRAVAETLSARGRCFASG
jgi:hypothetical protein